MRYQRPGLDILLFVSALILSSNAHSGVWSSGGGELVKDSQNPWFLENTHSVHYCVAQDESAFHLAPEIARRRVREALQYWKDQFARGIPTIGARVATQTFHETSCEQSGVDLRFQFGILSSEQLAVIGEANNYVALAIRTDYDRVNMRGRGFIYVAPDSGPLRPDSPRLAERPWQINDGALLLHVLAHELGHVFGIQHSNDLPLGSGSGLMSAAYPEYILDKAWAANTARNSLPPYFEFDGRPYEVIGFCGDADLPPTTLQFWGLPVDSRCIFLNYANNRITVDTARVENDPRVQIGVITLGPPQQDRLQPALSIWLPKEQTVFRNHADYDYLIFGPRIVYTSSHGIYRTNDGRIERSVHVSYPLNEVNFPPIWGILDGKFIRLP